MVSEVPGHDVQDDRTAAPGTSQRVLAFDVANDLRRFIVNGDRPLSEARRGDSFIAQGKIFWGGTIPRGGTMTSRGPFDPDAASGSIGWWTCRGVFHCDFAEIVAGVTPHAFATQVLCFNDGAGLITEGPEGGPVVRALVGGMGMFADATGSARERPLGTNATGLFNLRLTFHLRSRECACRGGQQSQYLRREP